VFRCFVRAIDRTTHGVHIWLVHAVCVVIDTEYWWTTQQAAVYGSNVAGGCSSDTYHCVSPGRKPVCYWCKLQDSACLPLSSDCRSEVVMVAVCNESEIELCVSFVF